MGGGVRDSPNVYWSGFGSQGSGACFVGRYSYAKNSVRSIREYAPYDEVLERIATSLALVQKRNFYQLEATIVHTSRYYHSGSMTMTVGRNSGYGFENVEPDIRDKVEGAMEDLANWLYHAIESQFDYETSPDVLEGEMRELGAEFYVDGSPA